MISDDDLQRIVLGNTPEGRILARVLNRLAGLEVAQAKALKRNERLERYLTTLQETLQAHVIAKREYDPVHEAKIAQLRDLGSAIRQDLAEMDRQRQPEKQA